MPNLLFNELVATDSRKVVQVGRGSAKPLEYCTGLLEKHLPLSIAEDEEQSSKPYDALQLSPCSGHAAFPGTSVRPGHPRLGTQALLCADLEEVAKALQHKPYFFLRPCNAGRATRWG